MMIRNCIRGTRFMAVEEPAVVPRAESSTGTKFLQIRNNDDTRLAPFSIRRFRIATVPTESTKRI